MDRTYTNTGEHTVTDDLGNSAVYTDFKWRLVQYQGRKADNNVGNRYMAFTVELWEVTAKRAFTYEFTIPEGSGKYDEQDFENLLMTKPEFAGSTEV